MIKMKIIPTHKSKVSRKRLDNRVLGDNLESIELQTEASRTPAIVPPATKAADGGVKRLVERRRQGWMDGWKESERSKWMDGEREIGMNGLMDRERKIGMNGWIDR